MPWLGGRATRTSSPTVIRRALSVPRRHPDKCFGTRRSDLAAIGSRVPPVAHRSGCRRHTRAGSHVAPGLRTRRPQLPGARQFPPERLPGSAGVCGPPGRKDPLRLVMQVIPAEQVDLDECAAGQLRPTHKTGLVWLPCCDWDRLDWSQPWESATGEWPSARPCTGMVAFARKPRLPGQAFHGTTGRGFVLRQKR
jgi:hypothetical protein